MTEDPFEGLHDPAKFIVPERPWFLSDPGVGSPVHADYVIHVPVRVGGGPVGRMVPIFTDEDLADRFLAFLGKRGIRGEPFQLADPDDTADLLDAIEALGVDHVSFDPGERHFTCRGIRSVADAFRGHPGDP